MQNTLGDLNNHLFAQLERLDDEDLEGEKLKDEVLRAGAVRGIAKTVIENAALVLEAEKFKEDRVSANSELPGVFENKQAQKLEVKNE